MLVSVSYLSSYYSKEKTIAFFVTSGFAEADYIQNRLEHDLEAFLPESCDYRGTFLCGGELSDLIVRNAEKALEHDSENAYAKFVLANYEKTKNRPDSGDLAELWSFLIEKMDMKG